MKRLTTDNPKTMVEKSHNQCYIELGEAMLRGFEEETSCRDFARRLLRIHTKADYVNANDDFFDECILDALQYGHTDIEGVIAMYYDALVSNAELREQLKKYEDAEENGTLAHLPFREDATLYVICEKRVREGRRKVVKEYITKGIIDRFYFVDGNISFDVVLDNNEGKYVSITREDIGNVVFLTHEEAMQALEARDSKGECK